MNTADYVRTLHNALTAVGRCMPSILTYAEKEPLAACNQLDMCIDALRSAKRALIFLHNTRTSSRPTNPEPPKGA